MPWCFLVYCFNLNVPLTIAFAELPFIVTFFVFILPEKVLDLASCLAIEDDSIYFSHDNRGLQSMRSVQSDVTDDNSKLY